MTKNFLKHLHGADAVDYKPININQKIF